MRIKIKVSTVGADEGSFAQLFEINRQHCVLGRQGADVMLSDPGCSRRHAMLYEGPQGELRVMDLHSINGTFLGTERIVDRVVEPGMSLRMGAMVVDILEYYATSPSLWTSTPQGASPVRPGAMPPPLNRKR